jgi:hypothetical protein
MSTYNQIAWLPLCAGLTGLGLVASWLVFRRRGLRAGLRGVAWSLLPLAAYLTGAIEMIWKMGAAIGDFATSFVFSPEKWAGVAVAGAAALAFVLSGLLRRARPVKGGVQPRAAGNGKPGTEIAAAPRPGKAVKRADSRAGDEDFRDIEKILRDRGL